MYTVWPGCFFLGLLMSWQQGSIAEKRRQGSLLGNNNIMQDPIQDPWTVCTPYIIYGNNGFHSCSATVEVLLSSRCVGLYKAEGLSPVCKRNLWAIAWICGVCQVTIINNTHLGTRHILPFGSEMCIMPILLSWLDGPLTSPLWEFIVYLGYQFSLFLFMRHASDRHGCMGKKQSNMKQWLLIKYFDSILRSRPDPSANSALSRVAPYRHPWMDTLYWPFIIHALFMSWPIILVSSHAQINNQ